MANANPYAPPTAHVADVDSDDDQVQPVRTWSAQGRIGRLRYLAHMMAAYLVVIIPAFVAGFLQGMGLEMLGNVLMFGIFAVYIVFVILKTIQRSHDMNWSGWTSILAMIPVVNLVWIFGGGTKGGNRFGPPTPPNTLGVKILGLAIPVTMGIALIAILLAVALPAYQAYTVRAQAGQVR